MLRISRMADYASVVMTVFARHPAGSLSARDVSKKTDLTLPTVSKLLKLLTNYHLLNSERGVHGGYHLARSVHDISVADIITAVDDGVALTACSAEHGECSLETECAISSNWCIINRRIESALRDISLHEIALTNMAPAC